MFKFAILLSLLAVSFAYKSYEGYQTWSIEKDAGNIVRDLFHRHEFDVLAENKEFVDILVEPTEMRHLHRYLSTRNIQYEVKIKNLGELIESQRKAGPTEYVPNTYNTLTDIHARLDEIAAATQNAYVADFPNPTLLGNVQKYIVFEGGSNIIWIDCGIHAREWVTPATCMHGVEMFAAGTDDRVRSLLESSTVYVMPVWNPDGYEFTFSNDRMWRKNRNPNDGGCAGVDLNRNFDDNWGGASTSRNPCSDLYIGVQPASEIETQNGQDFFQSLAATGNFAAMYSIHSYSQMWMYAYGYDNVPLPNPDHEVVLNQCTLEGVNALTAVYNTQWTYGSIARTIYAAAGTTVDYAYTQAGITHSYTLELRDSGEHGFILPEDQVEPAGIETWAGLFPALECAIRNP